MGSVYFGGSILMKGDKYSGAEEDIYGVTQYPFEEPTVYLDGAGEEYYPQIDFTWADDSVTLARKDRVLVYTQSYFTELLAENEEGDIVWIDGRTAPYSNYWGGKYLNETRAATAFTTVEYDLKTLTKKKYKMVLDEETPFDDRDFHKLKMYVSAEVLEEVKAKKEQESAMENLTFDGLLEQSGEDLDTDKPALCTVNYKGFSF